IALTKTIPIISRSGDPLGQGIVTNLARPGANVTAIANVVSPESEGKVLSVLAEVVPAARRVAYISAGPEEQPVAATQGYIAAAKEAASKLGLSMTTAIARVPTDEQSYDQVFAIAAAAGAEMLQFGIHAAFNVDAKIIARLALESRLPAISP